MKDGKHPYWKVQQTRIPPTWRCGVSTDRYCALCTRFHTERTITSIHTEGFCSKHNVAVEAGECYCDEYRRNKQQPLIFTPYCSTDPGFAKSGHKKMKHADPRDHIRY